MHNAAPERPVQQPVLPASATRARSNAIGDRPQDFPGLPATAEPTPQASSAAHPVSLDLERLENLRRSLPGQTSMITPPAPRGITPDALTRFQLPPAAATGTAPERVEPTGPSAAGAPPAHDAAPAAPRGPRPTDFTVLDKQTLQQLQAAHPASADSHAPRGHHSTANPAEQHSAVPAHVRHETLSTAGGAPSPRLGQQ